MKRIIAAQRDRRESLREIENRKLAYRAALEGIVLLKNDGTLPLKRCDIALYGAGARFTVKGGSGSGEVNERHSVSIYEGLKEKGFRILSDSTLNRYEEKLAEAKQTYEQETREKHTFADIWSLVFTPPAADTLGEEDLADCDTAIFVLSRQAGEGKDRRMDSYRPSESEVASIRLLAKHYRKLILIINSGSSVDLSDLEAYPINAVIFFCQQGMEGGNALASLLTGEENFSAKLTDTWVRRYEDVPFGNEYSYLNGDLDREYYREGIYVGYRYYDTFHVAVRYPFGYGLSYTEYTIDTLESSLQERRVFLKAAVKNTGTMKGKQVVQVYVSCPKGKLDKEYQRLVAFAKTKELLPEETQILDLDFDMEYCSSFDQEENCSILEKGKYIVRVGESCDHTKIAAVIENGETIVLSRHADLMPCREDFEELRAPAGREEKIEDVPVLTLDPGAFKTVSYSYPKMRVCDDERVASIMKRLTLEEKVALVMGESRENAELSTNYIYTPGSVARTSELSIGKGLININLADGPAGLRLLRESALDRNGRIKYVKGNYPIASMELFREAEPIEETDTLLYQYTSAFPVATALAQSFNTELVEEIGKSVSGEMREFNITYWLAPGMNIHRNPLCGRNFEYYSEDPLLTGKIAAALIRGVQSIRGNYITIKHLACNSAEENRTFSDSIVKQRALREIYLKGFEIAVREGHASGAMTSYNKINGVYASDSYDMSVKILRDEWGFDGVIMTDWTATIEGHAGNVQAVKTGHLIMPGGKYYRDEIIKGLKDGSLKEEELDIPVSFLVKAILDSDVASRIRAKDII